jgi:SagB-type dehydrogenase family enzyme
MSNAAIDAARRFHELTTHTPTSVRMSGHTLDWNVKPFPFKVYTEAPSVALPREIDALAAPAMTTLAPQDGPPAGRLTLAALTAVLYYAAGITKKKTYPGGGEVLFRAAASTGALYQTEVYVVAGDVEGLPPGLYHFSPGDFLLRRLREADVRGWLAEAAADASIARRAATLALTAIYWRNTWKYQARGFRHLFWDSGTMLANLTAAGTALGLAPRIVTGFVDGEVNRLLGVDPAREGALELVALGPDGTPARPVTAREAIALETLPLSSREVDYPLLREMYEVSALPDAGAVGRWRQAAVPARAPRGRPVPLPKPDADGGRPLGETIQRRGSTRRFSHAALTAAELSTALWAATRPPAADVPGGLVDLYLIVNAVDDVAPGAYVYWPDGAGGGLESLERGDFRRKAAYLCLEQALAGDAAAVVFFLTPLDAVLEAYGNRGYRLANLDAGLAGGRAYLAAYAHGFGASGLTFYDSLVVDFFAPHAAGKAAIFVTVLGRAASAAGAEGSVLVSSALQPPRRRV